MVLLDAGDCYTKVSGANIVEQAVIKSLTSAKPVGYQYTTNYRMHVWDGNISLFKHRKFPSGLLHKVTGGLLEHGIDFEVIKSDIPKTSVAPIHAAELRDYQKEAVSSVLRLGRGVLKMATNSGKTLVAASIIMSTGCRAVIVVPSRALLLQTAEKLETYLFMHVGRYGAGHKITDHYVTVVTIASLAEFVQVADLSNNVAVIIDEVHHCRSKSIFDTIFEIPGQYRIGMSGTPLHYDELDDMKLVAATGDIIYEVDNAEMIEAGYSAKPVVFFATIDTPDRSDDIYRHAHKSCIIRNTLRNCVIADIAKEECARGPVLILVKWIEHAKCIHLACERAHVTQFITLTGKNSTDDIQEAMASFGTDIKVVIATNIFSEGIDIPAIATVILADGGVSHIALLQKVGRGLRVHDNKDELHVYDFIDDTNPYLLTHSMERYDVYEKEGFETRLYSGAKPF